MRRIAILALLVIGSATVASAGTVRTFSREFDTDDLRRVRLDVPVGDVEIRGTDGDKIRVEVRVQCDRGDSYCRDVAEDIELVSRQRRNEIRLDFDGVDHDGDHDLSLEVEVQVPAAFALDVDLGVGELRVGDVSSDVYADVGVGHVRLRMQEDVVGSVDLEVGIGEAKMRPDPRRRSRSRGFNLGENVRWDDGDGDARIRIDVGVGGIDVRLR